MRKKIVMFLILFISMTFICNVQAFDDENCRQNWKTTGRCGDLHACTSVIDDAGNTIDCVVNGHDKELWNKEQSSIEPSSCFSFDETSCENSKKIACVWNETKYGNYCNTDNLLYVSCGNARDIPYQVPQLVSFAVNFLKIATPIILIIVSIISLVKALAASKEDEIKKATQSLIKKLIAAVMVFFIISIVQFVILKVADKSENGSVTDCMSCLLNNDCGSNAYYKTNVGGTYICKDFKGNVFFCINNEKTSVSSTSNNADNKMSGGGSNF